MESLEISVLEVIRAYDNISQRDISTKVGLSLGTVNLLIHKFAKVGLIKIEQLNGKKVQYILTPQGFAVLSKKTIDYISRSYSAVLKIKNHMSEVLNHHYIEGEDVLIFGVRDEVFAVLVEVLKEQGRGYRVIDVGEGKGQGQGTGEDQGQGQGEGKFVHWDVALVGVGVFLLG